MDNLSLLLFQWLVGLSISLIGGHFASDKFRDFRDQHLQKVMNLETPVDRQQHGQVPSNFFPIVTGLLERLFFTVIIAFDVSGGAISMIAWLGTKMAVNWNRLSSDDPVNRALTMTALQSGMVSLFFALIGGLICR